jgi:pilus assembly protein CpaE
VNAGSVEEARIRNVSIGAFIADEGLRAGLEEALSGRLLAGSSVTVRSGGLAAAIAFCGRNATPDILVVEAVADEAGLVDGIDRLAEVCDPDTRLIVVGGSNDISLYRTLLRRGVSDYLVRPIQPAAIVEAVCGLLQESDRPAAGRVTAFVGAKGGVGSTTLACNLAWMLSRAGSDNVALVDLDIAFGAVALAFNVEAPQGIDTALANRDRLDPLLLERYMPRYGERLMLLASPASLTANSNVDPEALAVVLEKIRLVAAHVVLDLPHAWAPWMVTALAGADDVVATATPELASLRNLKRLFEATGAARGPGRTVRYVVNQVGGARKHGLSARDFTDVLGAEPVALIPHDPATFAGAAAMGRMIGEINRNGRVVGALRRLAEALGARASVKRSALGALVGRAR